MNAGIHESAIEIVWQEYGMKIVGYFKSYQTQVKIYGHDSDVQRNIHGTKHTRRIHGNTTNSFMSFVPLTYSHEIFLYLF